MKQKILDLIIAAKRDDPETGSFAEWLAEYLVEHGVTVHEWIPVEERLPTGDDANETDSILAIHKDEGYVGRWLWDIVERYPSEFTHWMPLPEPPGKDGV